MYQFLGFGMDIRSFDGAEDALFSLVSQVPDGIVNMVVQMSVPKISTRNWT